MKILILGAGQVGSSAAYHLSREEANEVTVVDMRSRRAARAAGSARHPHRRRPCRAPRGAERAGANDADIVVALTDTDETNMVACQVAYTMFHTPTKIARIRSAEYMNAQSCSRRTRFRSMSASAPSNWSANIEQLILYPGASQVLDFADGRVRLVGAKADRDGLLVGQRIATLKEHIPNTEGTHRGDLSAGQAMLPEGDTVIQEGDEVFFIADRKDIRVFMSEMRQARGPGAARRHCRRRQHRRATRARRWSRPTRSRSSSAIRSARDTFPNS